MTQSDGDDEQQHEQLAGWEGEGDGEGEDAPLVQLVKQQVDGPVQELVHGLLVPAALSIQQVGQRAPRLLCCAAAPVRRPLQRAPPRPPKRAASAPACGPQDIAELMQDMHATQCAAEGEKAQIDGELARIQQLVAQFQARIMQARAHARSKGESSPAHAPKERWPALRAGHGPWHALVAALQLAGSWTARARERQGGPCLLVSRQLLA